MKLLFRRAGLKLNTVLIVSGDKQVRQTIRHGICRSGVLPGILMECFEGKMALEILMEQKVDMLITELELPDMEGLKLLKQAKLTAAIKTIVIGGRDDFYDAVELLRLRVKDYILKPVDEERLSSLFLQMEQELEEEQKKAEHILELERQQLKYLLMFYSQMTDQEIAEMIEQSKDLLPVGGFQVCCTRPLDDLEECNRKLSEYEKYIERKKYLCLGEVRGQRVILVPQEFCKPLLMDELYGCYVGISSVYCELIKLPKAYEEATFARKQAFCQCIHKYFYCSEDEEKDSNDTIKKVEDSSMRRIAQMLGTEKRKEAVKRLEYILFLGKKGKVFPDCLEHAIQVLIQELVVTFRNILSEDQELLKFQNMYQYGCLENWQKEFEQWSILFYQKLQKEFVDDGNKLKVQQAVEYICQNYQNDLNMAVVSNYVSMNYSLFSYSFKQYTGRNFVTYLKELRLGEAKRLLEETDDRITEISRKIGYENVKHFMKTFKEAYGVSPTEYRKNVQYKEES